MRATRHDIYVEHRFDISPTAVETLSGSSEITEARAVLSDGYEEVSFYGYRTRKDGGRATGAAFGLIVGIDLGERAKLEAEVLEWVRD